MKILVLEDEEQLANFIQKVLEKYGFDLTISDSIDEVIEKKYYLSHDLIILDLMLKGDRGETLLRKVRHQNCKVPVLVLSALSQIQTKIELINMGADDYMVKPFHADELVARINALYRRYLEIKSDNEDEEEHGSITFFWKRNKLNRSGVEIQLSKKEAELLKVLLHHESEVVTTEELLTQVWGGRIGYQSNVVQSTVRRLRKKIDSDFETALIENIHGIGYRLSIPK